LIKEKLMKKYLSVVFALMLGGLYMLPVWADSNGDQPETPSSMKQAPVASSAETDSTGVPKLVVEFATAQAHIPHSYSKNITAFGQYVLNHPGSQVEIRGYAD